MGLLKSKPVETGRKWYAAGLRFGCKRCGHCCSGAPGYVWVNRESVERIASFLGCEDGRLGREHLRRVGLRYSLTEKPGGDCIFLIREQGRTGCAIHPVRPAQCRTWPFWSENLRSASAWETAGRDCPGINSGKLHSSEQIEELRRDRGA
jgi:hypothetical protein